MADMLAGPMPVAPASSLNEATLGDVGRAVRRRWRMVALPTLAAFLASAVFVNVVAPRYTGEAKLLLQSADSYFLRMGGDRADSQQQVDEQAVASQVQVVMSRDLAREAIRKLGLVGNPEFDPLARGMGLMKRMAVMVGLSKDPAVGVPEDRVLDEYYEHLVVYPVGKSRIVSVEFRAKDPDLAARAANTVAEVYLGMQQDVQRDVARSASSWLGTNIDGLRDRVAESEAKVEAYRARTGLLSGSGTSTLSAQQLSDLSTQLTQARTAKADSEAKARMIRDLIRDGRAFEIPDVANNELVRRLIEQRVNLRAQLALESRTLLSQHPRIKELNAQLGDLEGQIRGAGERTARTLENDAKLAAARVDSLESAIEAQKKVVVTGNGDEVQLRALEREARTQRDQLEGYLTRYREATARNTENAYPAEARIVSRAVEPITPSFPKKLPTVLLATLAAMLVSIGIIAARELLGATARAATAPAPRSTLPVASDLSWVVGPAPAGPVPAPPAASLPSMDRPSALPPMAPPHATELDHLPGAEPDPRYDFGLLVARLTRFELDGRARRILVTGIERGDAASAVGEGLALTLAQNARTILIELDSDDTESVSDVPGLTDLVAGEASFTSVIRREATSRLHRVGIGTLRNEALTKGPDGVDIVLSALDETYDWIVCRLVAGGDDSLLGLTAPRMDAVVIASNLEPANPALVRAYETAREAGARDVVVAREQAVGEADSEAA